MMYEKVGRALTDRISRRIPNGYVVRNPTIAELQYAINANQDDAEFMVRAQRGLISAGECENIFIEQKKLNCRIGHDAVSDIWKENEVSYMFCTIRGTKDFNAWGIGALLYATELTQDTFARKSVIGFDGKPWSGRAAKWPAPESYVDPFWYAERDNGRLRWSCCYWVNVSYLYDAFPGYARYVIGPDLMAEKTNKALKNPAQKGTEKTFWIAKDKGIKLSMIHCPAGTFRKGFEKFSVGDVSKVPSALIPHDVKISRPFWMAKYPMTFAQVKELAPSLAGGKDWPALTKAHGQYVVFSGADGLGAAAVCRELNARFKAEMPSGYVFRLPTEAEWEYCLKEGGKCADNRLNREGVYSDRAATSWTEDRKAAHPEIDANRGCGVGTLKPNGWGFYDMIGTISQLFLDNGPFQCGAAANGVTVDPFQNDGSSKNHAIYPKPGGVMHRCLSRRVVKAGSASAWFSALTW